MLVLWIENFFSHGSDVVIFYMAFVVAIEEFYPSPLLFLYVVPFSTYLSDDEEVGIFVEFPLYFCKSELNGFVIYEVFE